MESLASLAVKARIYAQHGGAWPYLASQLRLHGVPVQVVDWYIECAKKNLSSRNALIAEKEFGRIIEALDEGTFGIPNDVELDMILEVDRFKI
ncbi:hypothetical protein [Veronia pacifica]|uniref:Uncharacterized protein n=1 Tax=Veronia pacifica TaxID=1080227 RepID=A0A1C3EC70_9GAMM|nr:hypothetical protein [Veronia pacifica]ODA30800.1 hypothetical protein A8L45_19310 [Veronia pacifica]